MNALSIRSILVESVLALCMPVGDVPPTGTQRRLVFERKAAQRLRKERSPDLLG